MCPWIGLDFGFEKIHGFGFGLGFVFRYGFKSKSENPNPHISNDINGSLGVPLYLYVITGGFKQQTWCSAPSPVT